jgi:hypothetical protein
MAEELGWVHNILEMGQRLDAYDPAATLKKRIWGSAGNEAVPALATLPSVKECLYWIREL